MRASPVVAVLIVALAAALLLPACTGGRDRQAALAALEQGHREQAARALRGFVPRSAEDWGLLERVYTGLNGFEDEAVRAFLPLGRSAEPEAVLLAARVAISVDRVDAAAEWLAAALDRHPEDDRLAIELAKLRGRAGRHREAIALLAPRAGADPRMLNLLGYEWLLAGDDARAEAFLRRSIEQAGRLGRPYAPPHYHLGLLLAARGEDRRALEQFTRALAANPRHLEAAYQGAVVAERIGAPDELARFRARFGELYRERLERLGALDPAGEIDESGEPVVRPVSWEDRVRVEDTEFVRRLPAGARVAFACLAPAGGGARYEVSAGGQVLFDALLGGGADEPEYHPATVELPAGEGDVEVRFRVRPVGLVARLVGRAPAAEARFTEPVVLGDPARRSADPRPNILLISLDTLRADRTTPWLTSRPTTPAIARLAQEGLRFARAEAPSNWTLPSHYSMLSGLPPAAHGVMPDLGEVQAYQHPDRKLNVRGSGAETMLAEVLDEAGYHTLAVTEDGWVSGRFGFAQGFDLYRAAPAGSLPATLAASLAELRSDGAGPFFLFVHTYAPHQPYHAPRRFRTRWAAGARIGFAWPEARVPIEEYNRFRLGPLFPPSRVDIETFRDLYDGQAAWADTLVERLVAWLDEAGLREQTLVVVTSDHGEEIFERGQFDHGDTLFEEVTHVPLVLNWPGRLPAGRVVTPPVSLVDLPATVLDLAGMQDRLGLGRSLRPLWEDSAGAADARPVFAEAIGHGGEPVQAVWFGGLKLIRRLRDEGVERRCHDLRRDPGERINLAGTTRCDVGRLEALLDAHLDRAAEIRATLGETLGELDEQTRDRLRGLGYVR
ncbi:MAG: hypothetical protein D6738_12670 [Acidobacteria bacterium]|nr:MAG: hypothetical protein D6738_12670 [Acidobacteriota bacterium]